MKIHLDFTTNHYEEADVKVLAAFQKKATDGSKQLAHSWNEKGLAKSFAALKASKRFNGAKGSTCIFNGDQGETILLVGMGVKTSAKDEEIRRAAATAYKAVSGKKYDSVVLDADSFNCINDKAKTLGLLTEGLLMTAYSFDKYLSEKKEDSFSQICLFSSDKKIKKRIPKSIRKEYS